MSALSLPERARHAIIRKAFLSDSYIEQEIKAFSGSRCQRRRAARPFDPRLPRAPRPVEASLQTRLRSGSAGHHRLSIGPGSMVADQSLGLAARR